MFRYIPIFLLALSASAADTESPDSGLALHPILVTHKSAKGYWNRQIDYRWSVHKSVSPSILDLAPREAGVLTYTLNLTRTADEDDDIVDDLGVSGKICVSNFGLVATRNLKIVDQVQVQWDEHPGEWIDVPGWSQEINPEEQLGPGKTRCYPYQISFGALAGRPAGSLRNKVTITAANRDRPAITHHRFCLPKRPKAVELTDDIAGFEDEHACPAGFECDYLTFAGMADKSTLQFYNVRVKNVSARCGTYYDFTNTIRLTEMTSGTVQTAISHATVSTAACSQ